MKNHRHVFIVAPRPRHQGSCGIAGTVQILAVGAIGPLGQSRRRGHRHPGQRQLDYGELGLRPAGKGLQPRETLSALLAMDEGREDRQIGIVVRQGNSAALHRLPSAT
jgi:uncharacterized Ntn-hydrolase superfamily protein